MRACVRACVRVYGLETRKELELRGVGLSRNNWSAARFGPVGQFRRAITGLHAP